MFSHSCGSAKCCYAKNLLPAAAAAMIDKYWSFLNPASTKTDQQFHLVLVYLTQLNDPSLSKIVDKRFKVAPYVCANIDLHPDLKHSLRELAHLYFNGDIRPRETINGLRLIKLLDVINNLHHKRRYMYTSDNQSNRV